MDWQDISVAMILGLALVYLIKKYTKKDEKSISRSHFTIYKKDEKYFIKDGVTNVQNKPSENHTIVNEEKLSENERELKSGDKILVSDVLMLFEV